MPRALCRRSVKEVGLYVGRPTIHSLGKTREVIGMKHDTQVDQTLISWRGNVPPHLAKAEIMRARHESLISIKRSMTRRMQHTRRGAMLCLIVMMVHASDAEHRTRVKQTYAQPRQPRRCLLLESAQLSLGRVPMREDAFRYADSVRRKATSLHPVRQTCGFTGEDFAQLQVS